MVTVSKLASRRLKHNKSRSALTVVALVLITTLLTALGSAAIGLVDFQRKTVAFDVGNTHATLKGVSHSQGLALELDERVESLNLREPFADIIQDKLNGALNFNDVRKEGIVQTGLTDGRMPEAEDEITGPPSLFERLGVDEPAVGKTVTVSFRVHGEGEIVTRDFIITGIQEQADLSVLNVSDARIAFGAVISEALVKSFLQDEERYFNAQIRVEEEGRTFEEIEAQVSAVAESIGLAELDISLNTVYLMWMTDPGTDAMAAMAALGLLVVFLGGLVIYNIYYVSVISNIQELGKLKALGATKKQMKQLLLAEGMRLAAVSIPVGLILGYGCSFAMFSFMSSNLDQDVGAIRIFSLPVTVIAAAAVLFTVWISLMKPMKMAGRISPVEAMRYQEQNAGGKSGRKGYAAINLSRLSFANLARNRKRTLATVLTLGLTCVLFLAIGTVLNNLDVEDYARMSLSKGDFMLSLNYSLNDTAYPENNLDVIQMSNPLNERLTREIKELDGVVKTERSSVVSASIDHPSFAAGDRYDIGVFAREDAQMLEAKIRRGSLDYDQMTETPGLMFNWDAFFDEYGLEIGERVPVVLHMGGEEVPVEAILSSSSTVSRNEFWITEDLFDQLTSQIEAPVELTGSLYIYVESGAYDSVKEQLKIVEENHPALSLMSLDEEMRIAQASLDSLSRPVYGLLLIVGIISFMSLINTMITSILTRKRELGILQAIGLTHRQLRAMLQKEGMFLTGGALALGLTAGNLLGLIVVKAAAAADMITVTAYRYPVVETVILIAAMALGQLCVTVFISRYVRKEALVDRMRSQE